MLDASLADDDVVAALEVDDDIGTGR